MYIGILEEEIENEFTVIDNAVDNIKNLPQDQIYIDDSETNTKDAFISEIKPTHYEAMKPKEVLNSCSHLNDKQKEDLRQLIKIILSYSTVY